MAIAQGGSPISFVDGNGAQYAIPLPWITFGSAGPSSATWPGWTGPAGSGANASGPNGSLETNINNWLGAIAVQGLLTAGAPQPNPPAFTVAARDSGSTGNDIVMTFSAIHPNTPNNTADVTVTVTQIYAALTITSIQTVLGTQTVRGSEPGLAVVGTPLASLPSATAPMLFSADPTNPPRFAVGVGILLPTHDAATEKADAGLIAASITSVAAAPGTFTLTLTWTKSVTGIPASALGASFGYVLTVTPPAGGFGPLPPANTSVTLLGGTDSSNIAATAATATVISG